MRRYSLVYLLIPIMLAAAASLAYYGYSYSSQLADRERSAVLGTMSELAKEKLIGIQTVIADADRSIYDFVDFDDLAKLGQAISTTPHRSVAVLGLDKKIVPGGTFRITKEENDDAFTKLLIEEVVPALQLESIELNDTRYLHHSVNGTLYLYSASRLFSQGKMYFVVLEWDIYYLFSSIFPVFFDNPTSNLYQVVNQEGELIYGYDLSGISKSDIVTLRFPEILRLWKLRVAQRDASALATSGSREKTLDLVLMGVAMMIILAGLIIMSAAVRRERRLSQLKSDFISNVSHELKTPLSIISMFGELLAMGRAKSEEQSIEYAEIIRRESMRLSALIDNVLDFAKIERGGDPYCFEKDQDLGEIVSRAVEICGPRLEQAKMSLDFKVAEKLSRSYIDGNAMVLAVQNLVDNAIKYAAEGRRIEVEVKQAGKRLVLEVRDFGPGIPEEEWLSIFDRFYRSKEVRLKPIRGSGIGLSLVKDIAEAHKGGVKIVSNPKYGSIFRVWIPITGKMQGKS